MRNENLLKSRVSEICVKGIRGNQGVGIGRNKNFIQGLVFKTVQYLVTGLSNEKNIEPHVVLTRAGRKAEKYHGKGSNSLKKPSK